MRSRFSRGLRSLRWATWPAAGGVVLVCVCLAAGQGPAPKAGTGPSGPAAGAEEKPPLSVPGFWALAMPPVQKEIHLTDDQRQDLQAIAARIQAKMQAAMAGLQRLSPEEQQRRLPAIQQQARKDVERARKEVANVLTAQQLQSYEKIAFRLRVPAALEDARLLGKLDLTDSQRAKLGQIRDNLEERLHHVQCEAADKALDILTPAQQQKLKDQFGEQGW